nr:hypothetical protein [Pseudomonas sp. RIT623]
MPDSPRPLRSPPARYLNIAIPLVVLPGYAHNDLGFSAVVAGLAISVRYPR